MAQRQKKSANQLKKEAKKIREYYDDNKDKQREKNKKWYDQHGKEYHRNYVRKES